jgi:hypothetical protein
MSPMPSLKPTRFGQSLASDSQRRRLQPARAAVVDDHADLHRAAHGAHVRRQAGLARLGQVVGQKQETARAGRLGVAREVDRERMARAVPAMIGTLPLQVCDATSMTLRNSRGPREKNSPVPPAAKQRRSHRTATAIRGACGSPRRRTRGRA